MSIIAFILWAIVVGAIIALWAGWSYRAATRSGWA